MWMWQFVEPDIDVMTKNGRIRFDYCRRFMKDVNFVHFDCSGHDLVNGKLESIRNRKFDSIKPFRLHPSSLVVKLSTQNI